MTKAMQKPVQPLSAEPPTVERLLKAVLRSGLLARGQLQAQGSPAELVKKTVLGVDLSVPAGQVTMLLGRNGAGKTTTLRTVMGLWAASQGTVTFDGVHAGLVDLEPALAFALRAIHGEVGVAQQSGGVLRASAHGDADAGVDAHAFTVGIEGVLQRLE